MNEVCRGVATSNGSIDGKGINSTLSGRFRG